MPDLSVAIGSFRMRNPVMLASGTVGYGTEYEGVIDFESVGAVVLKTVTLEPRRGNAPPRLRETEGGLLNAIGLENVGLEAFLETKLPEAARLAAPLVASAAATNPEGFAELVREMGAREEIAAIELNVSCPNVERAQCPLWADAAGVGEVVAASRAQTDKTLLLKLSPNAADVVSVAEAAERAGADGLVVANTMPGMRIDVERRRPALGNVTGGLSGPALMPVNLALVWSISRAVDLPLVGSGGVRTSDDALEYMMAGATAVQVGTAIFADPRTPSRVATGLMERMKRDGVESPTSYVGVAHGKADRCTQKVATG